MQAVLFADRHGAELAPLCDSQCPALLSVANRPLIELAIEDLVTAGATEILIVVSDDAAEIRAMCGEGALWGVVIRYLLSRGEEAPDRLLARFSSLLKPPFLAARGDVLRRNVCREFLRAADAIAEPVASAAIDGTPLGLCMVRQWPVALPDLDWPPRHEDGTTTGKVFLQRALFDPLTEIGGLHRAVLAMAAPDGGGDPDIGPPGIDLEPGLRVDRLAEVDRGSRESGDILVGARSWVHPRARLTGPCVIGSDCYIDRDARLRNSVILPGTYVGEGLEVDNAIVAGTTLIRVDLGIEIPVGEPKLLGSNGNVIGEHIRQWPERLIGIAMLAMSLPLWPLAVAASALAAPRALLTRRLITVKGLDLKTGQPVDRAVGAWQFTTRIPVLRHLPMLGLVARGDLRLFGARPLPVASHRPALPPGQRRHPATASGLLGPSQLYLSADASQEELDLWERTFTADVRLSALASRLAAAVRLLFSRRAWRPTTLSDGGV